MKCATKHCRNDAAKGRTICFKCKSARYKQNNPERHAYNTLKNNAKRRGVFFNLSFEEFKEFCYKYDYIAGRGRTKESYSIDRIDNMKGYTKDNIQVLTLSENSSKGKKILHAHYCPYERKVIAKVSTHHNTKLDVEDWDDILKSTLEGIDNADSHPAGCSCCTEDDDFPF